MLQGLGDNPLHRTACHNISFDDILAQQIFPSSLIYSPGRTIHRYHLPIDKSRHCPGQAEQGGIPNSRETVARCPASVPFSAITAEALPRVVPIPAVDV